MNVKAIVSELIKDDIKHFRKSRKESIIDFLLYAINENDETVGNTIEKYLNIAIESTK